MADITLSLPPQEASTCDWPEDVGAAEVYGKLSVELKAVTSYDDMVMTAFSSTLSLYTVHLKPCNVIGQQQGSDFP